MTQLILSNTVLFCVITYILCGLIWRVLCSLMFGFLWQLRLSMMETGSGY